MSNNKKFNPEVLGFYAILIVMVLIVSLSLIEGGKWIYNKITDDTVETVEDEYGPFYEFNGEIAKTSYENIFNMIDTDIEYYVITLDIDDDYNCESCGEFEDSIVELLTAYVNDEDKDTKNKLNLYIMDLNSGNNNKILGDANNGHISSYANPDHGYKDLKIDREYPISIMHINLYNDVEINNSATDLQNMIDELIEYYFYECTDCEEE